jgi:hypothetical protein
MKLASVLPLTAVLLLAACSSPTVLDAPIPVRGRAPVNYEKSITNFLDLTIRGPQPNRVLTFGKPEPGGCPVGGRVSSELGWVVPVQYGTRTGAPGEPAGVVVKGREYYFWFRQETIYGVTPKMELCP